jgi:uncharacterized delta-60 repeat protein
MEERRLLSGGVLDATFGTGGIATLLVASGVASSVATYPQAGTANDGKIVVGGWNYLPNAKTEFSLVRYNLDGSLDKSFGGTGEVGGPMGRVRAVAIEPDGKILAAGMSGNDFAVARYNTNGSLDITFGNRGVATTGFSKNSFDEIFAVGLQADGKIVVAGGTTPANSTTRELAVVRYNANGTLDTSFGTGGKALDLATSPAEGGGTQGMYLAIDPGTGSIIVQAADPAGNAMIVDYTASGKLDTRFNGTGHETLSNTYSSSAVAIQPSDHRIVLACASGINNQTLVRLNSDGTADTTFGTGGTVTLPLHLMDGDQQSVKIQADGRIVVAATAGTAATGSNSGFIVTRFDSINGSLDTSFGVNGIAIASSAALPDGIVSADMALEPDGRIVVAGNPYTGFDQFVVARFLATGPQIGSLTAGANADGSTTLYAGNISDRNPGASITQVLFTVEDSSGNIMSQGYGAPSTTTPGSWIFTFSTTGWPSGEYTLIAQAEDSYGVLGDPLEITESLN